MKSAAEIALDKKREVAWKHGHGAGYRAGQRASLEPEPGCVHGCLDAGDTVQFVCHYHQAERRRALNEDK